MPPPKKEPRFDQVAIGRRVRAVRKSRGYSAASLGEAVGIGEDAMLKKEKGHAPFFMHELTKIGDLLEAPSLWPLIDWDAAILVDHLLHRSK